MAKKKKTLADSIRNRRKDKSNKVNPFEVKVNKQKYKILGRKIPKYDKGNPGVSRSKAIQKRKETLLYEYNRRFKNNQLIDRRFGENDTNLSLEEKMLKRYAMERERNKSHQSKFNLNEDEEELTHFGKSLSDVTKFDEPSVSSDEEDRIGGKIVANEHFGGFLTRKETNPDERNADNKTWKETMEDVIANSKKAKYERQSEREKSHEMTVELDEQWKNLHEILGKMAAKNSVPEPHKPALDDYDMAVRELKYEMRGKASDRLKTEEELAKEEKERLDGLEADRKRRMRGIATGLEATHYSTDGLDDGFNLDNNKRKQKKQTVISYVDGKLVGQDDNDADEESDGDDEESDGDDEKSDGDDEESDGDDEESDGDDEESDDDDEESDGDDEESDDDNEEDDNENASDNANSDEEVYDNNSGEADEDVLAKVTVDEGDGDDSENESDDSYADVLTDSDGEGNDSSNNEEEPQTLQLKSILKKRPESQQDKKMKEEMKTSAKKEIPYTFKAPEDYEELLNLLQGHSDEDQLTIIDRIRKCHHVSLAEGNKAKIERLLQLLVQYYGHLGNLVPQRLSLIDQLTMSIYNMAQVSSNAVADTLQRLLQRKQADFSERREQKRHVVIAMDSLLYLKLVSILFPTSDFQHPVTTPAMIYMAQLLSQCPVTSEKDVASGLFLCSLALEYVGLSKRFIPEVINFLHGVLFLAAKKEENKIERLCGSVKPVGKSINLLYIPNKKSRTCDMKLMKLSEVLASNVNKESLCTPEFRINLVHYCVTLLNEFSNLYCDLPCYSEIFAPVLNMCSKLPVGRYPALLQDIISKLVSSLKNEGKPKQTLFYKEKPKMIKLFEPLIEENWDNRKKRGVGGNRDENDKVRLEHKVKREMKGAIREVRKDTQFLARQQLKESITADAERKRKVKELFGMLTNQEGDFNSLKRKKKKKT